MARRYHTEVEEKKAVEFQLSIPDLEKYKDAWLIIHNNAREYPDRIYKVYNSSSFMYVLCPRKYKKEMEDWLSQFGEITDIAEDKIAVVINVSCDYDDFDKDYIDYEYALGELD